MTTRKNTAINNKAKYEFVKRMNEKTNAEIVALHVIPPFDITLDCFNKLRDCKVGAKGEYGYYSRYLTNRVFHGEGLAFACNNKANAMAMKKLLEGVELVEDEEHMHTKKAQERAARMAARQEKKDAKAAKVSKAAAVKATPANNDLEKRVGALEKKIADIGLRAKNTDTAVQEILSILKAK